MIDHDLDQENLLDPLGIDLAPFTGYEVNHHCPLCNALLREFTHEQVEDNGSIKTVGHRLECRRCNETTAYMRSLERAAAAVAQWKDKVP